MKILAFTDMHGSLRAYKKLKQHVDGAEVIVCAGDFTVFAQAMEYLLMKINKLGKKVLIVHGNHEDPHDLKNACSLFTNTEFIHKKGFVVGDYLFIGYGGGGFSLVDKEFEKKHSKELLKIIEDNKGKKVVFVTHAPPYGTKVDRVMDEHCGNKSFRKFLEKAKPMLMICGHLHENAGKMDTLHHTKIINPGPYGMILDI